MSKLEFRELEALAKIAFEKTKSITYERSKLFTRTQEAGETLESFHAALTAQAAKDELDTLEDELVRGLFILRMKNAVLQDSLTFETFPLDEVLKRAIKFEQSKHTTQAYQKSYTNTAGAGSLLGSQIKKTRTHHRDREQKRKSEAKEQQEQYKRKNMGREE